MGERHFMEEKRSMEVKLSLRLAAVAHMVTPGNRVCDVGCDHGFLSIYLVQKKISPRVIAMDVRSGPLSRGAEHIADYGLGYYIDTRMSDGLKSLEDGEADTLVCAGMGGRLMKRILLEGREKTRGLRELILQPQSDVPSFRKFLREEGYRTLGENMIEEEGKFYPMMKVVPAGEAIACQEPLFDRFGELLLKERNPVLKRYLKERRSNAEQILRKLSGDENGIETFHGIEDFQGTETFHDRSLSRRQELEEELAEINRALSWFSEVRCAGPFTRC